ncbi:MAG: mechanosensitive ion channel family protein [Rickettsiales bacterium]|nr:mechanosensitive ion channel family protein [Rickettsiales bacterium]
MQPILDLLPAWALLKWHATPLWVWVVLPILFVTAYSITYVLGRISDALVRMLFRRRENAKQTVLVLLHPLELLAALAIFNAGKQFFPLSKQLRGYSDLGALFVSTFAIAWLFFGMSSLLTERLERTLQRKNKRAALAILPLLQRFLKITVALLAVLFLLQNLGFNVAALLAGLGVGGIAIALASQKSMENLFGGIMLILDQPVRVGDYCRFGDNKTGTVEDIGLRSARIRTPEHTIVSIPNSEFSQMQLENFAEREKMLFKTMLLLRYDTTSAQLSRVLERVTELLLSHPLIDKKDPYIRLVQFGSSALELEIYAYVTTRENKVFLQTREQILLQIMDIVREEGSDFITATPSFHLLSQAPLADTQPAQNGN